MVFVFGMPFSGLFLCVLCVCVLGLVGVVLFSFWFLVVVCFSFALPNFFW